MAANPLSFRILALSWLAALLTWPLVWLALASAQGLGVAVQGGEWIGAAVPWGQQPWGLVNQPHVGFAATRGALVGYWLPPLLAALGLATVPAALLPSGRGWPSELVLIQVSLGAGLLGLGWAPGLGIADGPIAGLVRFWSVPEWSVLAAAPILGAAGVYAALARLGGYLWQTPSGPTRVRRLVAALLHAGAPALAWPPAALALGWQPNPRALAGLAVVLLGSLVASWIWVPRAPLRSRREPGWGSYLVMGAMVAVLLIPIAWAGMAVDGHARALLWTEPGATNNVRPNMVVVRVMPRRVPEAPPEP